MSGHGTRPRLIGRRRESDSLCDLVDEARAGRGGVLVIRGDEGIGKTALIDLLVESSPGCRLARAQGVAAETGLAYGVLHQLLDPFRSELAEIPASQREALIAAFGATSPWAPDPFAVATAALALLSQIALNGTLLCCVDDGQWADTESVRALEFSARRLRTSSLALVLAIREPMQTVHFTGFPEMLVQGLTTADATDLLQSVVTGTIPARIGERIVAESRGNPLTLLEGHAGLRASELAFGARAHPSRSTVGRHREQGFLHEIGRLPSQVRLLMLTAALEPTGDIQLLVRAAQRLSVSRRTIAAAEATGLLDLSGPVVLAHPLFRAALIHQSEPAQRRRVHHALAEAMDEGSDHALRVWHRSLATLDANERLSSELERMAGAAQSHGGLGATSSFLERAAELTADPDLRATRWIAAAGAMIRSGDFDNALSLLARAGEHRLDEQRRATIDVLTGECRFAIDRDATALCDLVESTRRVEAFDPRLAYDTYLRTLEATQSASMLIEGTGSRQVVEAVKSSPVPVDPRESDALLVGLVTRFSDGYASAVTLSRRAVKGFLARSATTEETLGYSWLAAATAASLWEDTEWDIVTRRYLDVARQVGAQGALASALAARTLVDLFAGELQSAARLVDELASNAPGSPEVQRARLSLAALRGDSETAEALIHECGRLGFASVAWARAVLYNGLGRYGEALIAARVASDSEVDLGPSLWALAETVEAGARSGEVDVAQDSLTRLSALAQASGSDWAVGVYTSRSALLSAGRVAERLYCDGIEHLGRTGLRLEVARARLLYGEWLRREGRRLDARTHLRASFDALSSMGVEGFAERARHELLASGEHLRWREPASLTDLTFQQSSVARLAVDGRTNHEIASALYISQKTVEWHMSNVFVKLGVGNRRELRERLNDEGMARRPAD